MRRVRCTQTFIAGSIGEGDTRRIGFGNESNIEKKWNLDSSRHSRAKDQIENDGAGHSIDSSSTTDEVHKNR